MKGGKLYQKISNFIRYFRLLKYTEGNPIFFQYLMLISNISIFFIFVIYIYLIMKSLKGIQVINKNIFYYLRIPIFLFRTIFYIPLIEIFFTVIVCDRNYFNDNIKCWKSEHIIYFVFCIISFLFLIFLSYLFTCISFNKKEKYSSNVSKYLIINTDVILLFYRAIDVILLEIGIVIDILNLIVIFFLLSSLFSFYYIIIERKYQNLNNYIAINIKYIFNIFFVMNCIMLFICNLIKQYNIDGLFIIFLLLSIFIIIYIYSFSSNEFNILKRPLKRDREFYNNIRIIIQLVENKYNNRDYLLQLLSYSFNLSYNKQLIKIKKIKPLKKIQEIYNNELNDEEMKKFEIYFYQYIEGLFKDALKIYQDSVLLLVNYSIFQLEKMHRYHKAYMILLKCLNLSHLNFREEFLIYRIKRDLEEKVGELGQEQSYISYIYQINNMISLISEVSFSYSQLYSILLNNTKINIHNVKEIAIKIDNLNNKIHDGYKLIKSYGFNNQKINWLYNSFLRDILNDTSKISDTINDEQLNEDIKINSYFIDINSLISKSDFQFLIASGESKNFGTIIKISLELCELIGYSNQNIIGQNINILIPNILRIPHENFLKENIKNVTIADNDKKLKLIPVCFKTSTKFLIPVNLEVGIYYDENDQLILFSKLIKTNNHNKCVVMINNSLIIQTFSANATFLLGLDSSFINENIDISDYFIEFNKDFIKYMSNKSIKNIIQTKLKLIKEYFLENKIITWKNNKQFKVECKELNINKKIYGYSIFFESYELNENDRKNYIEEILSPRRMKTKNQNENKLFPVINNDYIPEIEEKINFDINSKTYIMKNDTKTIESIRQYFENKYNKIEKKPTKHVDFQNENKNDISFSNFDSEESSEFENEEYSSFEEEENENEKEEENKKEKKEENKEENKEKIKKEKEEQNLNIKQVKSYIKEIIIEKSNYNYYEVNLKKVYFQIYDYKTNIFKDCKDYIIQSKMSEILNNEQEKLNNKIVRTYSQNVIKNKSNNESELSLIQSQSNINHNNNSINSISDKIINKITSQNIINTNILYYLIFYIFQLISLLIISIIIFKMIIKYKNDIFSLFQINYNQCNIIGYIGLIQFYTYEYILLKNPNYYNLYQINRTQYRQSIVKTLNFLYLKCSDEIKYFDYVEENYEKNNKQRLKNLKLNYTIYYKIDNYNIKRKYIIFSPDNAIKEYLFSLFKILIIDYKELNFLNINLNNIQINTNELADILSLKAEIYIDCIKSLIIHIKKLSWIIYIIFILICIICFIISLYLKIRIIKEKEKYLGMFYKIDNEIIKIMLLKCEQYTKIQIDKDNPIINNIAGIIQNDDEIDSFIDNNEYNKNLKNKYYDNYRNLKKKKDNFMKNIEFKKSFILEFSFIIILLITLLILILLLNSSYKIYEIFCEMNYKLIIEGKYIFTSLNTIRTSILYSETFYKYNNFEQFIDLIPKLSNNYLKVKEIQLDLHMISLKYKLPGNTSNILNTYLSQSYCKFFDNFGIINNISCENFIYNISNYDLPVIEIYYFNNMIQLAYLLKPLLEESLNNGNIYYDFYYDTPLYVDVYDNKEYVIKNPFSIINHKRMKNSNIIMTVLIYPLFQNLILIFNENITQYNINMQNLIIIFIIIFLFEIIFSYIIFIIPIIFKENKSLNKTKIILRVIPKIILNDIIKSEYLNDYDSTKYDKFNV